MNLISILLPFLLVAAPATPQAPKFTAKLYADHEAIAPGGKVGLAIEVETEKGWHAYHPIVIDAGIPTLVDFEAPPGVEFGEMHYPLPKYGEMSGIGYLGFERKFVIVTTVSVPVDYKGDTLPILAHVNGMVCEEQCVPVETKAGLKLKVRAGDSKLANEELFKAAREVLPPPLEESKYIKGTSVSITKDTLTPGDEAEIVLKAKVIADHHIQHKDPGTDQLVGARLYIEPLDGLKFGEQKWPSGKVHRTEGLGRVRELAGEFEIRVPVSIIDEKFARGPVALRILFTYQCCNDEGTCFPPTGAVGVVRFNVDTPGPALAANVNRGTLLPEVRHVDASKIVIDTPLAAATPGATAGSRTADVPQSFAMILVLAFFGGMILNITPCVFPVISIKILGFVKQSGEDHGRIFRLGLAFAAGVMVWFWLFAYLTTLGQVPFQYPLVVMGLATVLVAFSLSLFGVFEIVLPGAAADSIGQAASKEGYTGAFMNGFLATLLGTACTAPFFATAAAYAATQSTQVAFTVFTAAGFGMALPYILLSAFPGWLKALPRPGPWMVTFKQAMGFVLLGTACWLMYVLGSQLGYKGVVWTMTFLCFLSFALWIIGRIGFEWSSPARVSAWTAALATTAFGAYFSFYYMYDLRAALNPAESNTEMAAAPSDVDSIISAVAASDWSKIPWQPYQKGLAEVLSRRGYTVYVDYTASWCVSCQANKVSSLEIPSTRTKMKDLGVIPIEADYSNPNPQMLKDLLAFGHNSVPLNLVYPAGDPAKVAKLPVILTPGIVHDALDAAGRSRSAGEVSKAGS